MHPAKSHHNASVQRTNDTFGSNTAGTACNHHNGSECDAPRIRNTVRQEASRAGPPSLAELRGRDLERGLEGATPDTSLYADNARRVQSQPESAATSMRCIPWPVHGAATLTQDLTTYPLRHTCAARANPWKRCAIVTVGAHYAR